MLRYFICFFCISFSTVYAETEKVEDTKNKKDILKQEAPEEKKSLWEQWLSKLRPNSLIAGTVTINPGFEGINGYKVTDIKRRGFGGIFADVDTISHPSEFRTWDGEWRLKFTVPMFYESMNVTTEKIETKESQVDKWTFFRAGLNFQIEGTGHTPIGAFGLALGYARSYLYTKSLNFTHNTFEWVFTSTGFYRVFLNEKVYLEINGLTFNGEKVKDDRVRLIDINRSTVGIGYRFP